MIYNEFGNQKPVLYKAEPVLGVGLYVLGIPIAASGFLSPGLAGAAMALSSSVSVVRPVVIEIVDSEEYIQKIRPYIDEVVRDGLVTIEDVEILRYGKAARSDNRAHN